VLNRIYIAVGLFAILVLGAAFLVPRFIQWGDYRDRMEELAASVLGTDVRIEGEIQFDLLPQPRLIMTDVAVGDIEAPIGTIAAVEADFALGEFLRDQYRLTRLVLTNPRLDLTLDENGLFGTVSEADRPAASNVTLESATINGGSIHLADLRADETFVVDGITGELRLSAVTGPLTFQGAATYDNERYTARINTAALDASGNTRLSAFIQRDARGLSINLDGQFTPGLAPRYDGRLIVRVPPPAAETAEDIRGPLVFESDMQVNTDRVTLSGSTLLADENRPAARLTGAVGIQLGARRSFDAVVSGGVFSLPPRDPTEDPTQLPYELVRLLQELPAPLLPPIAGTLALDLSELNLRAFALRNVQMRASTNGDDWSIETLQANLPGDTRVVASGTFGVTAERPTFDGNVNIESSRLDALAQLWRRPAENNALFNLAAGLSARLQLGPQALLVERGRLRFGGSTHDISVRIGFSGEPRLDVRGRFGALSAPDSVAFVATLPDVIGDIGFGPSFPDGSIDVGFEALTIDGLAGEQLAFDLGWSPTGLVIDSASAESLGGVGFEGNGTLRGTIAEPHAVGSITLVADDPQAPALARLFDALGVAGPHRPALTRQLPADLRLSLSVPEDTGVQRFEMVGALGEGQVDLTGTVAGGITGLATAPIAVRGFLEASDGGPLLAQLGLPTDLFAQDGEIFIAASATGVASEGLAVAVNINSGEERVGFEGDILDERGVLMGSGTLAVELDAPGPLVALFSGRPVALPPVIVEANLDFQGQDSLTLDSIVGRSDFSEFSGGGALQRSGGTLSVTGNLALTSIDPTALAASLLGPVFTLDDGSTWPVITLDLPASPSAVRGRIDVTADSMALGDETLRDIAFAYGWDGTEVRLDGFSANLDGGRIEGAATLCCSGSAADRALTLQFGLDAVDLASLLPAGPQGIVAGSLQLEGAGPDFETIVASAAGQGAFTLTDLVIDGIDPGIYPAVRDLETVLEAGAEDLRAFIGVALGSGDFTAPTITVPVTVAAGVARMDNLSVTGEGAQMLGSMALDLRNLALDAGFVMTPRDVTDPQGLVSETTGRVLIDLGGTLLDPVRSIDIEEMVAAIQTRASEIQIDQLEAMRLIEAERQRQAAEERNRLIEQQRAEFLAQQAAREEAERRAQEALDAQQLELQQQPVPPVQPTAPTPATPPGPNVNQPLDLSPQLQFTQPPNQLLLQPNQRFGF
jgi:hypothetical protein